MGGRILIVDDSQKIRGVVAVLLGNEGYEMEKVGDGKAAVAKAENMNLVTPDVMIPRVDGFKTCRQIHEVTNTPILFLTAKTMDQDKALGFSNGGDNYLVKPFSYSEPIARVKALLHRYCIYRRKEGPQENDQIIMRDLIISRNSSQMKKKEEAANLTEMGYQISLLLADHPKKIFSDQELYKAIWEGPYMYSANNTIMVHTRSLHKRLGVDPRDPVYIGTVWGKGYHFD